MPTAYSTMDIPDSQYRNKRNKAFLLMEDGFFLLQENGSSIYLDWYGEKETAYWTRDEVSTSYSTRPTI